MFHCTPAVAEEMDIEVIRLLRIVELGTKREEGGEEWQM
jgi:hypothetical protein